MPVCGKGPENPAVLSYGWGPENHVAQLYGRGPQEPPASRTLTILQATNEAQEVKSASLALSVCGKGPENPVILSYRWGPENPVVCPNGWGPKNAIAWPVGKGPENPIAVASSFGKGPENPSHTLSFGGIV